jgi:hypothetical protein
VPSRRRNGRASACEQEGVSTCHFWYASCFRAWLAHRFPLSLSLSLSLSPVSLFPGFVRLRLIRRCPLWWKARFAAGQKNSPTPYPRLSLLCAPRSFVSGNKLGDGPAFRQPEHAHAPRTVLGGADLARRGGAQVPATCAVTCGSAIAIAGPGSAQGQTHSLPVRRA